MPRRIVVACGLCITLAVSARAAWTDPVPAEGLKLLNGCDTDSGKSIQVFGAAGGTYFLKSGTPGHVTGGKMLLTSASDAIPVQVFSLLGQPKSRFKFVGDDGLCQSGEAIEALGVALDRKLPSANFSRRQAAPKLRFVSRDQILIQTTEEIRIWTATGKQLHPMIRSVQGGRLIDLASVPPGPFFVRAGADGHSLTRF